MGINYRIIQQTALIIREKVTCMPPSIFYNVMPRAQRLICWRQAPQKANMSPLNKKYWVEILHQLRYLNQVVRQIGHQPLPR